MRHLSVRLLIPLIACGLWTGEVLAEPSPAAADPELDKLLSLNLEELTVTSVSRRSERLEDAAAAVYVITNEDIRRTGATSVPEVLRIVPGLNVAQISSNQWAVTARGFNGALANKLLVMIDGRTVYTPVYSGTYWDDEDVLLEDVDRIEVIRGPGATLFGANAVNGIISIITKSSAATQGEYANVIAGTEERQVAGRHGGRISDSTTYRVFAKYFDRSRTELTNGRDNIDDWDRARSGFRIDSGKETARDRYTIQGEAYDGEQGAVANELSPVRPFTRRTSSENDSFGGNLLGRWNHRYANGSESSLQSYLSHYSRDELVADQHVTTLDLDFQHNLATSERNHVVWGAGYRVYDLDVNGSYSTDLTGEQELYDTYSAFVQDEYALLPEELFLTLGTKLEHNNFTGFEAQPSARVSWRATERQTLWGSVSRAVRVPSLIESNVDLIASPRDGTPPRETRLTGNPDLPPEKLIAYELGYRVQPQSNLSFDTAVFYNDYSDLITFEQTGAASLRNGFLETPFQYVDAGKGQTYGLELSSSWNVTDQWRLLGSYSYINLDLKSTNGTPFLNYREQETPSNQFNIRSYYNVMSGLQWDNSLYYVDNLRSNTRSVDHYWRLDTRLGWDVNPGVELDLIGRNLLQAQHQEYFGTPDAEIQRSFLASLTLRF